jgi:3-oxoacyl-[acyl-carrier-protein] synthase II
MEGTSTDNHANGRRVVITGIGLISPIGIGVDQFWKHCLDGKTNIQPIPEHWTLYSSLNSKEIWSPLPDINADDYAIGRIEKMQLEKSQILALAGANLSLKDANYRYAIKDERKNTFFIEGESPEKWGVYVGNAVSGISSVISNYTSVLLNSKNTALVNELHHVASQVDITRKQNTFTAAMCMPNACSARIGIKYSTSGPNNTFCSACASGTVAIGQAFKAIQSGEVDCAITGGVESLGDPFGFQFRAFDVLKTLIPNNKDPMTANRPFDKDRSGFLFSEGGAAILILEELEHAMRKSKNDLKIYAEIIAFSETFDAFNIVMPEPNGTAVKRMIHNALHNSNLKPENIDYINTHGTSTVANDEVEAHVIEEVFGKKPLVNSTKSLLGHTIGASGAIETAVSALSIWNNTTHVCKNLENPIVDLNFVRKVESFEINHALTHSFAFGGHNAGLILKKY